MRQVLLAVVSVFAASELALGQGLSAVNGSVVDPSGAVVPGVKITATEVDTTLPEKLLPAPTVFTRSAACGQRATTFQPRLQASARFWKRAWFLRLTRRLRST